MKIGIVTDQVSMDLERSLKFAKKNDMDYVEIHCLWWKNVEDLDDDEIDKAVSLVNKYKLIVSNISSTLFLQCSVDGIDKNYGKVNGFPTINGNYDNHIKALNRCINIADKFKTNKIRIFGFWKDNDNTYDEGRELAIEKLLKPIKISEKAGIELIIENCPLTYFPSGSETKKIIEELNSKSLKALWDPGNAVRVLEELVTPYPDDYEKIKKYISHLHAKDYKYKSGELENAVPIGLGDIDYKNIIKNLIKDNYNGVFSLEPEHEGSSDEKISECEKSIINLKNFL